MSSELLARIEGRIGHLALNKPATLNALSLDMVRAMTAALVAWRDDAAVEAVMIDHHEGRGFCAGGDINLLRTSALEDGGAAGRRFIFEEYRLNHLLFTYPKPVVAFMDGITMGGGVGISQPARYRIATENTRFAMPETGIGMIPDVGGGWYLSRLGGQLGKFLALTGARLDGAECMAAGLASHYLPSANIAKAKTRIAADPSRIHGILGSLSITPPPARITRNIELIDRLFTPDTLEAILAALEADSSDWAAKELATLRAKSPQCCKVALRQLAEAKHYADFATNMRAEYAIASRIMLLPDFAEGVRALIVDKDNAPRWIPPAPAEVTEAMLDAIFAPLPAKEEWSPS